MSATDEASDGPDNHTQSDAHSIQCRVMSNVDGCACLRLDTMPMVEAMDLFDRFWNATFAPAAEDWTAYGLVSDGQPCECGNCQTCGIRYALLWTHNLLSNPSLADLAERKADRRRR